MTTDRMSAIFSLDVTKKFIHELYSFIESFSKHEEKLRGELEKKDYDSCIRTLIDICVSLKKIYAADVADEFLQTAYLLRGKQHESDEIDMFLADFLVYVSVLSIDIQMALFRQEKPKDDGKTEVVASGIAAKMPLEKGLVLAIDNSVLFLGTLQSYLKDTDFVPEGITTADAAIEFLTKRRPSVIFLGVDMPKMDGFELAAKVRELGHAAPIVFLTGNASEKNVMKAIEMGAAGFLVKPPSQERILKILNKLRIGYELE